MRLTEKENETLPIDVGNFDSNNILCFSLLSLITNTKWLCGYGFYLQIVLQTLLSFVMTCYGIVHIAGEFKDMDASSELKNK